MAAKKTRKRAPRKTVKHQRKPKRVAPITRPDGFEVRASRKVRKARAKPVGSRGRPGVVGGFQGSIDPKSSKIPPKKTQFMDGIQPGVEYQVDKHGFVSKVKRAPPPPPPADEPKGFEELKWTTNQDGAMHTEFTGWQNDPVDRGHYMDTGEGVKAVTQRIRRQEQVPSSQADALLAASSKHATASAKRVHPRLSRV